MTEKQVKVRIQKTIKVYEGLLRPIMVLSPRHRFPKRKVISEEIKSMKEILEGEIKPTQKRRKRRNKRSIQQTVQKVVG